MQSIFETVNDILLANLSQEEQASLFRLLQRVEKAGRLWFADGEDASEGRRQGQSAGNTDTQGLGQPFIRKRDEAKAPRKHIVTHNEPRQKTYGRSLLRRYSFFCAV